MAPQPKMNDSREMINLYRAIFLRALCDSIYICLKDYRALVNYRDWSASRGLRIIEEEHEKMNNWADSKEFDELCHIISRDEHDARALIKRLLRDPIHAARIAERINMKFTTPDFTFIKDSGMLSAFASLILLMFCLLPAQAVPFPCPQIQMNIKPSVERTYSDTYQQQAEALTLPEIHYPRALVEEKYKPFFYYKDGQTIMENVKVWIYVDTKGNKFESPIKIKGVKNATSRHPFKVRLKATNQKYVVPVMPYLQMAGEVCQILFLFVAKR